MKIRSILSVVVLLSACASATETEHLGMRALPAPGAMYVDGKVGDWDLSGGIFVCGDVESFRDQYALWLHLQYDAERVYILARWVDPTPLNNPGSVAGDHGFAGDCLQARFITRYEQRDAERVAHLMAWRDRDGKDTLNTVYGRDFKQGEIEAKEHGGLQAFAAHADGKGYTQEIALPWKLLTHDGKPLAPGDTFVFTVEPNLTVAGGKRLTIKDVFRPGVPPDRVFAFRAYRCWGVVRLEREGKLKPQPLRLADSRELPVAMHDGRPVVDWSALTDDEGLRGHKAIRFDMPVDGFASLRLVDAGGVAVRQLLTAIPFKKGAHEVRWDGLTNPWHKRPGKALPPGVYRWDGICHTGIGLRLRGWANNGGTAPWNNGPDTNWGGDHGVPSDVTTDGKGAMFLGWSGAEAGKGLVVTDLNGKTLWRHSYSGYGGAAHVAYLDGILYVDTGDIYRLDGGTHGLSPWEGSQSAAISIASLWKNDPTFPSHVDGLAASKGALYLSFSRASFSKGDVLDWEKLLRATLAKQGPAARIWAALPPDAQERLTEWAKHRRKVDDWGLTRRPSVLGSILGVLNKSVGGEPLSDEAGKSKHDLRRIANRKAVVATFAGLLRPAKTSFIAAVDAKTGKLLRTLDVPAPSRLRAGPDGNLYVVSNHQRILAVDPKTGKHRTVVDALDWVTGVNVAPDGTLYVALHAPDMQVRAYSPQGKLLRTIGKKGGRPTLGPWDSSGMAYMSAVAVDPRGKLWVAEEHAYPKRFSVWDGASGAFVREFFGPTHYGASGGAILPADPNVMAGQGCEWRLDPKTGRAQCVGVIAHETHNFARFCQGPGGRTYLIGTQNSFGVKVYERLAPGDYRLRASVREARPKGKDDAGSVRFWSDANDDQTEQDSEVVAFPRHFSFLGYYAWSASVGGDLAIYGGWLDRNTNQGEGYHIPVTGVTACGAPLWDVANPRKLPALVSPLPSLDNTLVCDMPYADRDERFVRCMDTATGKTLWTYPNDWHGVHGSHRAPPPEPGLLRGVFGFIGAAKLPEPVGDVWVMNTNVGEWHAMTSRGFYLTRLFESNPMRYRFPDEAVPGALMDGAPSGAGGEDFGGSLVQAADGRVYLQSGKTAMWNIEVVGLDTVRPLPSTGAVTVTADDVKKAESWRVTYLQESAGTRRLDVAKHTPAFTGDLRRDFAKTSLVTFRKSRETEITAGLAWDDTNLYLGFDVRDPSPWVNQAEVAERMYVSGDTVDLQLATDPKADSKRREAVLGDLRLSIGLAGAKPAAVIYRKVAKERHPKTFRSGIVRDGYIMDSVVVIDDAKIVVKVHGSSRYVVQAAIPLAALGLEPKAGLTLGADLGVTHGDAAGANTVLRTHWSNQNTGIVDDEVFELKMEPARWGEITFKE